MNIQKNHRRPIAEINVVPYIDVMLVLLVIFMVTAPLLTQGVQVELPSANAEVLPEEPKPPIIISVDAKGGLFLDQSRDSIDPAQLGIKVKAALQLDPSRVVLVRGDSHVDYGQVVNAMVILKRAGVSRVGLMTQLKEVQ